MSEYRKLKTQYRSRNLLREALKAAGIPFEECRPGQERVLDSHYNVDGLTATFIVPKKALDNTWGALGWHWDPREKCFVQIADHLDENHSQTSKALKAVKREYAVAYAMGQARAKGYRAKRVNGQNGEVQVVITGRL